MRRTITEIAKDAHENATMRDVYGNDPEGAIIDKLREEIDEFEDAALVCENANVQKYNLALDTGADEKKAFEKYIKNTRADELADLVIVALAGSVELGIDIAHHIELKLAYNKIR